MHIWGKICSFALEIYSPWYIERLRLTVAHSVDVWGLFLYPFDLVKSRMLLLGLKLQCIYGYSHLSDGRIVAVLSPILNPGLIFLMRELICLYNCSFSLVLFPLRFVSGSFILCLSFSLKQIAPSIKSINWSGKCFLESTSLISPFANMILPLLNTSSVFSL